MEGYHNLSPDTWGKIFMLDLQIKCSDDYIVSIWYKFMHFRLPISPEIHRMGNSPNIQCTNSSKQDDSHPHFILYCKLSKTTLGFINISGLINLNCAFYTPFKVSPKVKAVINGGFISQFHDGLHSTIIANL